MLMVERELILLRGAKLRRLPDGIIVTWPTPIDMGLTDAEELVATFWRLEPKGGFRLLIDQRGVSRKLDAAARDYLREKLDGALDYLAIVTGNTVSRFFASGILATMGIGKKARAFDSEEAALTWLRSFQKHAQGH